MRQLRPLLASAAVATAIAAAAAALVPATALAMSLPQASFDVQIFDRTEGRQLPTYQYQGRTYVVGKPGNEYSISLRSRGSERMMAVTSVDGVNIVSGQTASAMQSGYVISPWQTADIAGWRKSLDNTAAFYFTDLGDSYAARTGRPNNVGVIGVAVFRERRVAVVPPVVPMPQYRSNEQSYRSSRSDAPSRGDAMTEGPGSPPPASAAGSLSAEARSPGQSSAKSSAPASSQAAHSADRQESIRAEKSLGTGHGRIEDSRTRYTDFQRASSTPDQVITIHYDTYNNLAAIGVPVWRDSNDDRYGRHDPRPFPRDPTLGFAPDPSWPRY